MMRRTGWRLLPLVFVATVPLLLTACGSMVSDITSACPRPVQYSPAMQEQADIELEGLPAGSALGVMISDYGRERAMLRALQGSK